MEKDQNIQVLLLSPARVIYEGKAMSVILPGEKGVFEVLPYHKRLLSRLLGGCVFIDRRSFPIKRGVAKAGISQVTIIVEER